MAIRRKAESSEAVAPVIAEEVDAEVVESDQPVATEAPSDDSTEGDSEGAEPDAVAEPEHSSDAVTLTVIAPLVVVRTAKGDVVNLRAGDVVPDGTQQESIDHLLSIGFIK